MFSALAMNKFVNFSQVPPNATQDDIDRMRGGEGGGNMPSSYRYGEQSFSGRGRKPPSLSSHNVATFPTNLHKILSDPKYQHIIRWLPHGRSWEVVDQNAFMKDVAPHFFSFSKYASFTRQISGWNFSRKGSGPDRGSYYHELFLRGRPHLVKFMKREVVGRHVKQVIANDPENNRHSPWSEPDLFKLSKLYPLPDSSDGKRPSLGSAAETADSQQQSGSWDRTDQHRHPPAVDYGHRNTDSSAMHPSHDHRFVHHNGYHQWVSSGASSGNHNYFPPPAHHFAQSSQVQGLEPRQFLDQESSSDQRLYEQHRSSFLFNAPPLPHSYSRDNPNGTHYHGQEQGHRNQNVSYSTRAGTAHPPWQSYFDRERHLNPHHHIQQQQQQQQQQHRDNHYNHALGTTNEMHGGSTSDHEHPAEQQATLNDGNQEGGPGPAGTQNGSQVAPLAPSTSSAPSQCQPPTDSRKKDIAAINGDHLPPLDEEQRTALLGILGHSPSRSGSGGDDNSPDEDADADFNSIDNDDKNANDDNGEDDTDIDVSPIRYPANRG